MTRIPTLHVTEDQLTHILEAVDDDFKDDPTLPSNHYAVAKMILEKAKTLSTTHRSVVVTNEKLSRKTEKLKLTGRTDTGLFSELLVLIRRKFKHRAIKMVKPGETEWLTIKEIANRANEFVNEFGIEKKEGYTQYITIGMQKMTKYSLNRFKMLHASIFTTYEAKLELETDKTPEETSKCYKIYTSIINNRIGHIYDDYQNNVEKYVCFKKAKQEAEKMKLSLKEYITAQFEALEWANGIPDPSQLYGDKAIERARKYCYENNIVLSKKNTVDFSKIKG